jgi:hypothetical protein
VPVASFGHTWDIILAKSFILELQHTTAGDTLRTEVRIAGRPARPDLERLVSAIGAAVHPTKSQLRIARGGERLPVEKANAIEGDDRGTFVISSNHVVVRLPKPGPAVAADRELARRLRRRLEGEIASVKDAAPGEFDHTFEFALKKGGYRLAETPGTGITSVWLAEVPAEVEITVRLRTVETDDDGALDHALVQRMFDLCKAELTDLKRHDSPNAVSEISSSDWVLARIRS